jgi:hypothetical protein
MFPTNRLSIGKLDQQRFVFLMGLGVLLVVLVLRLGVA